MSADVVSLAEARAARRPWNAYENDTTAQGTPAGVIDNALIDAEWLIEQAQEAILTEDWATVSSEIGKAANLLETARCCAFSQLQVTPNNAKDLDLDINETPPTQGDGR